MTVSSSSADQRYTKTAIILHWVMAVAFLAMLASGFCMAYLDTLPATLKPSLYHWHKSAGILLLLAFFARLGWRLAHKPPILAGFPLWERIASAMGHAALYLCMFLMPFSGWVMSSARPNTASIPVFNWFDWPALTLISGNSALGGLARATHGVIAFALAGFILLHVAAVLKHGLIDKRPILYRMLWRKS